MTVQEMAKTIIALTPDDEEALRAFAEVETAAFQEYLSEYEASAIYRVCKGCHGG